MNLQGIIKISNSHHQFGKHDCNLGISPSRVLSDEKNVLLRLDKVHCRSHKPLLQLHDEKDGSQMNSLL